SVSWTVPSRAFCIFASLLSRSSTTYIYALSLHDALPIYRPASSGTRAILAIQMKLPSRALVQAMSGVTLMQFNFPLDLYRDVGRSEEHTSELQSRENLVCRLLLEKKNPQPT